MTDLVLSEMKTVADSELAVAHPVLRAVANSTRISAFLHLLLTERSQLLNYVEALIFYCSKSGWLEKR